MTRMEELCKQLSAIHISPRLQRAADAEAILLLPAQKLTGWMLHGLPFAHDLSCDLLDADLNHNKLARKLLDELPFAFNGKRGLLSPAPGKRPSWEPPVLDYTWYEPLLQGDKEITARDGKAGIVWRTEMMDYTIEARLLTRYWRFAFDARKAAGWLW